MKRGMGLEYENPKTCLKVAMAMKKEAPNTSRQDMRKNQRDSGVPSSANWKPTNPLMSKQQYAAATDRGLGIDTDNDGVRIGDDEREETEIDTDKGLGIDIDNDTLAMTNARRQISALIKASYERVMWAWYDDWRMNIIPIQISKDINQNIMFSGY